MESTIQSKLYEALERYKTKTAIEYGFDTITYEELDKRSNFIANFIINSNIQLGSFIAVLIDHRIDFTSIVIGILKAGCVFVPLDSSYPVKRIESMINIADVEHIFVDEINENIFFRDNNKIKKFVVNDTFFESQQDFRTERPNVQYTADDKIYVYFTSGTTGNPKAIVGKNKSLLHFINWEIETFNVDDTYNVSQFTTPCHDPWLRDILVAMFAGGQVCIPERKEIMLDRDNLINWIEISRISLIHCTPSLFRLFNSNTLNKNSFSELKYVLMAGERINPSELFNWYNIFGERIQLVNLYGSTETTMVKTYYLIQPMDAERANIPIGKPMKGARVIILDEHMNICSPGDKGEIYIRTPYRTYGYYNNPELNSQKFIQNPFNNDPQDIIYKTGDLGRILPDGNLEFLGRIDRQVKIRGIRVELEEIENLLTRHERIKEAVVTENVLLNGESVLCAYVVVHTESNMDKCEWNDLELSLRTYLQERLPIYMVPAYIVKLDMLPLTQNRKIDYNSLPEIDDSNSSGHIAPRDEIENRVVEICKDILGKEAVGVNENFMQIGGHSLNVMTLVSRIYQEFGVEIPLGQVFSDASIEGIAEYIKSSGISTYISIQRVEDNPEGLYPVSSAQRRQFILNEIEGAQTNYNITDAKLIEGPLDRIRLEQAYKELIQRHESFRTSFRVIDGEIFQHVENHLDTFLQYMEINKDEVSDVYSSAREIIQKFIEPFDLGKAPLVRAMLIKLEDCKHVLVYDIHHIIADETSIDIFTRELILLYNGEKLPELKIQYKDFSFYQNQRLETEEIKKQENYWLDVYKNNGDIPILNMPTDFPRPKIQSFEGSMIRFEIDEILTEELNRLASSEGATLYIVMLSILNVLLYKYTGQEDIIIGSPISGRIHSELENIIGMFVNILPMRNFPKGDYSFREFLTKVKENAFMAYENQEYQFEDLITRLDIKRDLSRGPLFDIMFVLHNMYGRTVENDDIKYSNFAFERKTSKMDMTISAVEKDGKIEVELEYCKRIFKEATINRFIGHFLNIVHSITENPEQKLEDVEFITAQEADQILYSFNNTDVQYDKNITIHEILEKQADIIPDNIAVIFNGKEMSYKELNERSNQLARVLRENNISRESIVALFMERSIEMIVGIFAVLKAGGAYLPISPEYPDERVKYILKDSNASLLLSQTRHMRRISDLTEGNQKIINAEDSEIYQGNSSNLELVSSSKNLAYVIYTSGSTGKPKGVMVEHYSVINRLNWMQKKYPIGKDDTILQKTPYTFDVSVWELFWWIFNGSKVCFLLPNMEKNPKAIIDAIAENKITVIHFVPSMLNSFLEYIEYNKDFDRLATLRHVFSSGEALELHTVNKFNFLFSQRNNISLHNLYGPTEATVDVSYFDCPLNNDVSTIPIGRPIDNINLYVLDKKQRLLPQGICGELYISGDGLARGYLNQAEMTKEKFVPNPFKPGERMYATGDIGRWLPTGEIEYLGRLDDQVKVRGFRIELGEIENQLLGHRDINNAVVSVKEGINGDKVILAYYVSNKLLSEYELKGYLSRRLPDYMVPARFIKIDSIPVSSNGKVDKRALPEPCENSASTNEFTIPENETEVQLLNIWKKILGVEKVSTSDNFFDIGGNSLTSIKLEIEAKKLGFDISIADIFQNQTIKDLALKIRGDKLDNTNIYKADTNTQNGEANFSNIIDNIIPFNEFTYKSTCFYNAVFSAVLHFSNSILPLLINDVEKYSYNAKLGLDIQYNTVASIERALEICDIRVNKTYKAQNVVLSLVEAINKRRPVVLAIDCFYESIREDTYQKIHWPHYILIYGYDPEKKVFHIVEHLHRNSLSYNKRVLSYIDIINSYKSYLDLFGNESEPTLLEFYTEQPNKGVLELDRQNISVFEQSYKNYVYEFKNDILEGLKQLKVFKGDFERIVFSEIDLMQMGETFIEGFNKIINAKKVELYKASHIYNRHSRLIELQKDILDNWINIRGLIAKNVYSKEYKRTDMEKCVERLNFICDTEYEYLHKIVSL